MDFGEYSEGEREEEEVPISAAAAPPPPPPVAPVDPVIHKAPAAGPIQYAEPEQNRN